MLVIILSLLVGFISGALVFRNNAAKAEKVVADGKAALEKAKELANKNK